MSKPKEDVITDWLAGGSGTASRFKTGEVDGVPVIIGYGWAVYAADFAAVDVGPDAVVLFGDGYASDRSNIGWAGYSGTTTTHIHDIKYVMGEYGVQFRVADARPATRRRHGGGERVREAGELARLAEEHDAEVQDTARYYYQQQQA